MIGPASIRIVHVSPSFYPARAYGGPIFSTKAITDGIACTPGLEVEVLSTDTANPNNRERLELPENPMELPLGYSVRYCRSIAGTSISIELVRRLWRAVHRADVVHLTGPYNFPVLPTLLFCRLTGTPLVWSPRGGFQATAQWSGAPKRRIKCVFENLANLLRPRHMVFHVTAEVEAETSSHNFPKVGTVLIPNAIEIPETVPHRDWQPRRLLRLAFLSRVHPKKGLDLMIPALASLPEHVTLEIYGDGEPAYINKLKQRIDTAGLTGRVRFHGMVSGEAKTRALINCDVFILPTHSENFGIVVAEALAHGTPVITTHGAPWPGIEIEGCGRWTAISSQALVAAVAKLDGADLASMGARGRAWMIREFSTDLMVKRFETLYRDLADCPKPKDTCNSA